MHKIVISNDRSVVNPHEFRFHLVRLPNIISPQTTCTCGVRGGLMISTLDSGLKGPGSSPGWVIVLCSWAKHLTLTVPLSAQEYKWVPANC